MAAEKASDGPQLENMATTPKKNAENRHMKKITGFLMFIESFAASVDYWAVAAPLIPSTGLQMQGTGRFRVESQAQ